MREGPNRSSYEPAPQGCPELQTLEDVCCSRSKGDAKEQAADDDITTCNIEYNATMYRATTQPTTVGSRPVSPICTDMQLGSSQAL